MVNPLAVVAVFAAGVLFLGGGGVQFIGSLLPKFGSKNEEGETSTIPASQGGGQIGSEIPAGSQAAVSSISKAQIIQQDIVTKSNNALTRGQFKSSLAITPLSLQAQALQTNLSTGAVIPLTQLEFDATLAKPLSEIELADIAALDKRRARQGSQVGLKASGATVVAQKRIQAELARKNVFDSRRVQNPNFELGLPSNATPTQINAARKAQADRAAQLKQAEENKKKQLEREAAGQKISKAIGSDQQSALLKSGIALRGSNLNAKALGRLRELNLI